MKNNDKQKRTDGTIFSSNMKMPIPEKSFNSPSSDFKHVNKKQLGKDPNQFR